MRERSNEIEILCGNCENFLRLNNNDLAVKGRCIRFGKLTTARTSPIEIVTSEDSEYKQVLMGEKFCFEPKLSPFYYSIDDLK